VEVEWFLKTGDKEVGPLSARQLKAMALKGKISKFDAVRRGSDGRWVPASSVKGLLPTGESSAESRQPDRTPVAPQTAPQPRTQPELLPAAEPPGPVTGTVPVAIPIAQPVVSTPDASGAQPAPLGQFHIDTSADTPASRVADRRGGTLADSKTRRRNNLIVVVVAVSVVVLGAVGAGVLLSRKGPGTASKDAHAASNEPSPQRREEREREPVVIRGLDEFLGEAGPKGTEEGESAAAASEWTDASTSSIECGDVTVKIASARIGRPRLIRGSSGPVGRPKSDCLWLTLELRNTNQTKKFEYTSWNVGQKGVRLVDDHGKEYPVKSFANQGLEIEGQVEGGRASLSSEEATEDVLLFERPAKSAKSLRLELPSAAFGETGNLKFEIPVAMIARPAESEEQLKHGEPSKLAHADVPPEAAKDRHAGEGADGGPIAIPGVSYEANDDDAFSFADDPKLQKAREELRRQRAEELRREEEEEKDKEREDARGARKRGHK